MESRDSEPHVLAQSAVSDSQLFTCHDVQSLVDTVESDDSPRHAAVLAPRRDLKLEAGEMAHLLTHKPANVHCVSCMRGKLRQVPHRAGAFSRPVTKWGEVITVDHMVQTEEDWTVRCDGSKNPPYSQRKTLLQV